MRKHLLAFPWSKYLAGLLVLILFLSQTIRVDFFGSVEAKQESYRDIVSIFVDTETYSKLRNKIQRYAEDIQGYLGETRVSLFVVDSGVDPAQIAAKNERLYYEGDDESGVSKLVGTILIGNIPLPVVSVDSALFPSLYPYVDFVDKAFTYNEKLARYEATNDRQTETVEADIWHGVINPSLGRNWEGLIEREKIENFLDKTHLFYTKSGRFAPSLKPPRVFYYDGDYESESVSFRNLFQYVLSLENAENIAYKRYTKYLLRDINTTLKTFDAKKDSEINEYLRELGIDGGGETLDESAIEEMPDIHTKTVILSLLKDFKSIINQNTLSDALANIHNAGRYNSGTHIRADLAPLEMTIMDEIARNTLKEANDALMKKIDDSIVNSGFSRKIIIPEKLIGVGGEYGSGVTFNAYYFGKSSSSITDPAQCSISRGSNSYDPQYGKDVLVEANVAFNILESESHIEKLRQDTEELARLHKSSDFLCFDPNSGTPRIDGYWGGNSPLRVIGNTDPKALFSTSLTPFKIKGYSESIFSLGGMNETKRFTPSSISDCTDSKYQYGIMAPYIYDYISIVDREISEYQCKAGYPTEWNRRVGYCPKYIENIEPRYTCLTGHDVKQLAEFSIIYTTLKEKQCFAGKIFLNGKKVAETDNSCTERVGGGEDFYFIDKTLYEDYYFKTIPGFLKHISPTDEEIASAEENSVTPSLPVDMVRYLEFLTPKGNIARINYPNFFEAPLSDRGAVRKWLKNLSDSQWNSILSKENSTTYTPFASNIESILVTSALPASPIDWNSYISDESIDMILRSRNWLQSDVTKKYKKAIETSLSYSREYKNTGASIQPPKYPLRPEGYDIAYLGLTPFEPASKENVDEEIGDILDDYNFGMSQIEALNISEPYQSNDQNPYGNSDQCGPPDGVNIFQWPAAIMCWIKTLLPPRIIAGTCSTNTLGSSVSQGPIVSPNPSISASTSEQSKFYEGGKLYYRIDRTSLAYNDLIEVQFDYIKDNNRLTLPDGSNLRIQIDSLLDENGREVPREISNNFIQFSPDKVSTTEAGGKFLMSSRDRTALINVRAILTIQLSDGTVIEKVSDPVNLRITPEYLQGFVKSNGNIVPHIDITQPSQVITLDVGVVLPGGKMRGASFPIKYDIIDEISGSPILTGGILQNGGDSIASVLRERIGVYKLVFTDNEGIMGETSVSVLAGPLANIQVSSVSSMIRKNTETLMMLSLLDKNGNPISPDLHTIQIDVSGGYLLDSTNSKITSMSFETMENSLQVLVGSDSVGNITYVITDEQANKTTGNIPVVDNVRLIITPESKLQVGGGPVKSKFRIVDASGNTLRGFNSVANITLSRELGTIPDETIRIVDGESDVFEIIPGTKSGNYRVNIDIVGLGNIESPQLELLPGIPLYVDHTISEDDLSFFLRDRYGNHVTQTVTGTLRYSGGDTESIIMQNGLYRVAKKAGYYTIHVPTLRDNKVNYQDGTTVQSVNGIPYYATYVTGEREVFDFLPDYNARYTVLFGDSYLTEAEDILYNTDSQDSQSLAVSTLLASPYNKRTLLRIFPDGKIDISSEQEDMLLETQSSLIDGKLSVHVMEVVGSKHIARLLYSIKNPELDICSATCGEKKNPLGSQVMISANSDNDISAYKDALGVYLEASNSELIRVNNDGKILSNFPVEFELLETSENGAHFEIMIGGSLIGEIHIMTDATIPVTQSQISGVIDNTVNIVDQSSINIAPFYPNYQNNGIFGYEFFLGNKDKTLDERMIGPSGIDSYGETYDNPGVGFRGSNTSLLSYAAGDTVGEATKWFHTYTFVNLGDPVAHVDDMAPGTQSEGIDRSIGTRLTSTLGANLASYSLRDMDNDGLKDIVTVDTTGRLSLILNLSTRFRKKEQIAYVPDIIDRGVSLADTTGDGYADIVGINSEGNLVYIENNERKFTRKNIILSGSLVPKNLSQFKIFDMDNDGKDDIVYLNELGELGILYGTEIHGFFTKKILESTLGITLSEIPETIGGAIKFEGLPQIPREEFGVMRGTGDTLDDSILESEIYSQITTILDDTSESLQIDGGFENIEEVFSNNLATSLQSGQSTVTETFLKSQYAPGYNITVERSWKNKSFSYLKTGDTIEAKIVIKNTGTTPLKNIKYVDTIPSIFDVSQTNSYDILQNNEKITRQFSELTNSEYDALFVLRDIAPNESLTISYELKALPMKHGNMMVDYMEKGESGDDQYGDVAFEASEACGDDILIWRSSSNPRNYEKGTRSFAKLEIPDALKEQIQEVESYTNVENLTDSQRSSLKEDYKNVTKNPSFESSRKFIRGNINTESNVIELGFDSQMTANIESMMQGFFDGLSCGFGGGSCMSFPLNWAPLAPGSAPTVFGYPIAPLIPETGIPTFSALTCMPITVMCGKVPCTIGVPSVFPASPLSYNFPSVVPGANNIAACTGGIPGAGGKFGTLSLPNSIRTYVTPTLTLGMGAALCFQGPSAVAGRIPPPPLFGLVKKGNCIVMAKPMPFCKGDGSKYDGDVTGFSGLGTVRDSWNAGSCQVRMSPNSEIKSQNEAVREAAIKYLKNPTIDQKKILYDRMSNRTSQTMNLGPVLKIGSSLTSGTEIGIEIDSSKPFNLSQIVQVKNGRVPSFPDFLMNWVTRQTEEIVNALFTAPSLVVIWPGVIGANMQFDGSWQNFQKRFTDAYSSTSFNNLKTQMGQAYSSSNLTSSLQKSLSTSGKSSLANNFRKWSGQALDGGAGQTINAVGGGIASVRAAYSFISQLPFLQIQRTTVNIDVPWILPGELDKYIKSYDNYIKEYERMLANWCATKTPEECANAKISLQAGGFISSIKQNLKILNDYKNFPKKLQKYVTWKQRYISELLCNVETVRLVLGGWIKDNGIRFKKWAELFVLLKAIAESWQPIIDLFSDTSKQCGVCTNQRYNSMHWKFKLLSAILPSPPIIRFPRWPDIVLDLSDIRLGINVSVPDFKLNVKPLRLPALPNLTLPDSPTLLLKLPALPVLPALPNLPDLPSLPSLPKLALPNLPPPPKIPKLLGSIQGILKVFKLLTTAYCFLNNTALVPEGEVGDVIAKRTERQGKLSLDFIGIKFPDFVLPSLREIRVSTHVNFELRSDFITEFAKQAVKPINEFTTDLGRGIPKKLTPDINLSSPAKPIQIGPNSQLQSEDIDKLAQLEEYFKNLESTEVDVDEFRGHILSELLGAGQYDIHNTVLALLKKEERENTEFIKNLQEKHEKKYEILTKFLQKEYDSTARLQEIIDVLEGKRQDLLSYTGDHVRNFVSLDSMSHEDTLLDEYTRLNSFPIEGEKNTVDTSYSRSVSGLLSRLDRLNNSLLSDNTTLTTQDTGVNSSVSGYTPAYNGVYILTPNGEQTRLFDADLFLSEEDPILMEDVDKDGDKDYLYILDGALMVKYVGPSQRSKHKDFSMNIASLTINAKFPTTPDYFHESVSSPKKIGFTFSSAQENLNLFRLEFFERYLEWDMRKLSLSDYIKSPRYLSDIEAIGETITAKTQEFSEYSVPVVLSTIGSSEGFQMIGPKVTVLERGNKFHLPLEKMVATGKEGAQISIISGAFSGKTLELLPYRKYQFHYAITAELRDGKVFAFSVFEEATMEYKDEYRGMPIIHPLRILAPDGGIEILDTYSNSIKKVPKGGEYTFINVGEQSSSYLVNLSQKDGMYSARIASTQSEGIQSDVILFAPQLTLDKNPPLIDMSEKIRIPVYTERSIDLRDEISEIQDYSIEIDQNRQIDDDNNGVYDDDFMFTGGRIKVSGKTLTFQPHTNLENYTFILRAKDAQGNSSQKAINVEIYSPIPKITEISQNGSIRGLVNEVLKDEPIHLFRARPGENITPLTKSPIPTNGEGIFESGSFFTQSGAILDILNTRLKIADNGIFSTLPNGYRVEIVPANTQNPMKFVLKDEQGAIRYEHFLILPPRVRIGDGTSDDVRLIPYEFTKFYKSEPNDPNLKNGYYITDNSNNPLGVINGDGNIYLIDKNIQLRYSGQNDHVVVSLIQDTKTLSDIIYRGNFFYTIK